MKTADEMFRELGYAESKLSRARSGCAVALYGKDTGDHYYEIEVIGGVPGAPTVDFGIEARMDDAECPLLGKEVLACAQLIKEMEENKNE